MNMYFPGKNKYWNGLLCPPQGGFHNPGIQCASLLSPALVGGFFTNRQSDRQTHTHTHTKSQNGQQTYVNSKQQTFRRLHWRNVDDFEFGNDFLNKPKAQSIKKKM